MIDDEIVANGMKEGEINLERDDEVQYINQEITYELPETGGTGVIIYTIAGAFCILAGAGFMYRNRNKEGRG